MGLERRLKSFMTLLVEKACFEFALKQQWNAEVG